MTCYRSTVFERPVINREPALRMLNPRPCLTFDSVFFLFFFFVEVSMVSNLESIVHLAFHT